MRNRPIRFAVGLVAATALLVPAGSRGALVSSYCTTELQAKSGWWDGGCVLPIAGPALTVIIRAYGPSSTPMGGQVYASLRVDHAETRLTGVECYAAGSMTSTSALTCRGSIDFADMNVGIAELPAAPGAYCEGLAFGAVASVSIQCFTGSI